MQVDWLTKLLRRKAAPAGDKTPVIATVTIPRREDDSTPYGDQLLRKQWAEQVLLSQGVPINPHLPMIEGEAEVTMRSAEEVANRLASLFIVAARGAGLDQEQALRFVAERKLDPHLTPAERAFVEASDPDHHACVQFSWRYEAAWALFWALGHAPGQLGFPREPCDVDRMTKTVIHARDLTANGLKPVNDILNEADLIYRYHWAVRQAGIDGKPAPAGLHHGVVMERHHALNWLIGYGDNADWDDVTTDT